MPRPKVGAGYAYAEVVKKENTLTVLSMEFGVKPLKVIEENLDRHAALARCISIYAKAGLSTTRPAFGHEELRKVLFTLEIFEFILTKQSYND